MRSINYRQAAVDKVKSLYPTCTGTTVLRELPDFATGPLLVVEYLLPDGKSSKNPDELAFEGYVLFERHGPTYFNNDEEFVAHMLATAKRRRSIGSLLTEIVPAALAMIFAVAFVAMLFIPGVKEVPQQLTAALSTVLAFFFGSQAGRRRRAG